MRNTTEASILSSDVKTSGNQMRHPVRTQLSALFAVRRCPETSQQSASSSKNNHTYSRLPGRPPPRVPGAAAIGSSGFPGEPPGRCPGRTLITYNFPGLAPDRCPPPKEGQEELTSSINNSCVVPGNKLARMTKLPVLQRQLLGRSPPKGYSGRRLLWQQLTAAKIPGGDAGKKSICTRRTTTSPSDDSVILVLDAKRRQNVEICLKGLGVMDSMSILMQTLYKVDPFSSDPVVEQENCSKLLTPESLQMLINLYPTGDEERSLRAAEKLARSSSKKLGKIERFLVDLLNIEEFKARAECFLTRRSVPGFISTTNVKLKMLRSCLSGVIQSLESGGLGALLLLVLDIGNYLNYGSRKGGARGFTVETLHLLKTVKSVDNSSTLLRTVVDILQHQPHGDAKNLWMELSLTLSKCHVSMNSSIEEMRDVKEQTAKKLRQMKSAMATLIHEESFQLAYSEFLQWARTRLDLLTEEITTAEKQMFHMMKLLAEKSKVPKDGLEILKQLDSFWKDLNAAYIANKEKERHDHEQAARANRICRQAGNLTARPAPSRFLRDKGQSLEVPQTARPFYKDGLIPFVLPVRTTTTMTTNMDNGQTGGRRNQQIHITPVVNNLLSSKITRECEAEPVPESFTSYSTQSTSCTSTDISYTSTQTASDDTSRRESRTNPVGKSEKTAVNEALPRHRSDGLATQVPKLNMERVLSSITSPTKSVSQFSSIPSSSRSYEEGKMPPKTFKLLTTPDNRYNKSRQLNTLEQSTAAQTSRHLDMQVDMSSNVNRVHFRAKHVANLTPRRLVVVGQNAPTPSTVARKKTSIIEEVPVYSGYMSKHRFNVIT